MFEGLFASLSTPLLLIAFFSLGAGRNGSTHARKRPPASAAQDNHKQKAKKSNKLKL